MNRFTSIDLKKGSSDRNGESLSHTVKRMHAENQMNRTVCLINFALPVGAKR